MPSHLLAALALCALALCDLALAQKNHGKQEIECHKENAVMGVGGKCHCRKGFHMKNTKGEKHCTKNALNLPSKCKPGHECGRECFDGKDNDGDGKTDCDDPDCQFDVRARNHCLDAEYGTKKNDLNGKECLITDKDHDAEDELKRIERYCCPNGDCKKVPDSCPKRCARVFVPFWETCGIAFKRKVDALPPKELSGLEAFYPICYKVEQRAKDYHKHKKPPPPPTPPPPFGPPAPPPVGTTDSNDAHDEEDNHPCSYGNYLSVAMACAKIVSGKQALRFGDTEFCRTKCFEATHDFIHGCPTDKLTPLQAKGLSRVLPYLSQCAHKIATDPGSGNEIVACDAAAENKIIEYECGKTPDEIKTKSCDSTCVGALKSMSNRCADEPEMDKYQELQAKCYGESEDQACKDIAPQFANLFSANCCGSDNCASKLPKTCSASCADAFMPYYSRCGSAQYGKNPIYKDMDKFAGVCAASKGRATPPPGPPDAPEVPGPSEGDQCNSIKQCGKCHGVCGWCRDEASNAQLNKFGKRGWCSSKCTTTKGECGRRHKNGKHGGGH